MELEPEKSVLFNWIAISVLSLPCLLGLTCGPISSLWRGLYDSGSEDFILSNNILPLGSLVYLLFCVSKRDGLGEFYGGSQYRRGSAFPQCSAVYMTWILPFVVLAIFVVGYIQKFARQLNILNCLHKARIF